MALPKCKLCSGTIDKDTAIKVKNRYICVDCIPIHEEEERLRIEEENKPKVKSDYTQLTDYISELYGGSDKVNFPLIATQLKYYVETYDMKYKGILLALKYYIEIDGNMFNTDFFLGQAVPKYYQIAKMHYRKIKELEREARELTLEDEDIKIIKVKLDKERKMKYNVEDIGNIR